jgi:uncharacterized protein involved in exopolysaccharide biosynthesis
MNLNSLSTANRPLSFTLKDFVAIGFRHKRVMALCFLGVFAGAMLPALLLHSTYRAETKLLVKKERLDPVVTPEQSAPMMFKDTISEEELNSEAELVGSEDVLRKVVLDCGLDKKKSLMAVFGVRQSDDLRIAKAVRRLRSELGIDPIKKTNMISVSYESENPQLAAKVLETLNAVYIQKHLEVHHPMGQAKFFEQETERYRKALEETENNLKQFDSEQGGVAPAQMRDLTLQKLTEFNSTLESTRAEIKATETRIKELEGQETSTPSRLTTQMRKGDDPQVLQQLKGMLATLELKRTELLTKYQSDYPLVVEVDKEVAETRATLAKEEATPLSDETTDQNPTYAWINGELAKAKADLSGLQARETATLAIVNLYSANARQLDEKGITQQDLLRTQKANEANYLLYLKKGEEARIADALDQNNILNVAVAQPPSVPALPTRSPWLFVMLGLILAPVVSMGLALTLDYMDQSFRTPTEVTAELGIPVLAAVPRRAYSDSMNGNGHRSGNGNGNSKGRSFDEDADIRPAHLA